MNKYSSDNQDGIKISNCIHAIVHAGAGRDKTKARREMSLLFLLTLIGIRLL